MWFRPSNFRIVPNLSGDAKNKMIRLEEQLDAVETDLAPADQTRLHRYLWWVLITWSMALLGSLSWNIYGVQVNLLQDARLQALVAFDKDTQYRSWNALRGGLYAPISDLTPPNPYLLDLAPRDITSEDGDSLTMINPAYMTRQVHELEEQTSGVRGHITSLNPIRAENQADDWEQKALQLFETGSKEETTVSLISDVEYFRFMRPLITEEACLQCHEHQGYKLGDVRGGISISIPLAVIRQQAQKDVIRLSLAHLGLWLLGFVGALLSVRQVKESTARKDAADAALLLSREKYRDLAEDLRESNDIKELLLDIITHDLKNPASVVRNISEMLRADLPENEMVELVQRSGDRILSVLENAGTLAKVSGTEEIEKHSRSMIAIITLVIQDFASQLKTRGMDLSMNIVGDPHCEVNPIIAEVFENFISNAIKYGSLGKHIEIDSIQIKDSIVFRVKDQGETIPVQDRERIFTRRLQLETNKQEGRGLGLAIVKRIAQAHGGDVWVEPNQPRGNMFCIKLAAASPA